VTQPSGRTPAVECPRCTRQERRLFASQTPGPRSCRRLVVHTTKCQHSDDFTRRNISHVVSGVGQRARAKTTGWAVAKKKKIFIWLKNNSNP